MTCWYAVRLIQLWLGCQRRQQDMLAWVQHALYQLSTAGQAQLNTTCSVLSQKQPGKLSLELSRSQGDGLDSNLPELHFITGEGAGLVTEDVLNLAQVLVQVAVARLGILPACGVLHMIKC